MAAESPEGTAALFVRSHRRALSCIATDSISGGYRPNRTGLIHFPAAADRGYIRLQLESYRARDARSIEFRFNHSYVLTTDTAGWSVSTTGSLYEFQLYTGREIVAHHVDSQPAAKVQTPHLHVRGLSAPLALSKAHVPTGDVAIRDIIRFAIDELGVRPRLADGQWQAILAERLP